MREKIKFPEGTEPFSNEIKFFFDLMLTKLSMNRHKGFIDTPSYGRLYEGLKLEMDELTTALETGAQFDVAVEAADVANFALLIALLAIGQDKASFEKAQKNAQ